MSNDNTFNDPELVLDTVYPCLNGRGRNTQGRANATPSVEVFSGAVNIYMSNNAIDDKPANAAAMTLLSTSPQGVDFHNANTSANWILFEQETATAVVKTTNLIDTGAIV